MATTYLTKTDTRALPIGTRVYCTVRACAGWYTVLAVRPRDGYIKITGVTMWCPPHNFTLTPEATSAGAPLKLEGRMMGSANRRND